MAESLTDTQLANIAANSERTLAGPWGYQSANWRARKDGSCSLTVTLVMSDGAGPSCDVIEAAEYTCRFLAASKELVPNLVAEVQHLRRLVAAIAEGQGED